MKARAKRKYDTCYNLGINLYIIIGLIGVGPIDYQKQ